MRVSEIGRGKIELHRYKSSILKVKISDVMKKDFSNNECKEATKLDNNGIRLCDRYFKTDEWYASMQESRSS